MDAPSPHDGADGERPAVAFDHARSRLNNLEGGVSMESLRIDTSERKARDCSASGHRWSFQVASGPGRVGRLVCVMCGEAAPNPAADLDPAVDLDEAAALDAPAADPAQATLALAPTVVRLAGM